MNWLWANERKDNEGADLSRPPPIYRPPASHLSTPGNPSIGRIASIGGRIRDGCDGADQSAVGAINDSVGKFCLDN